MQTIEIKNKKWTVGLEWEILPGEASFKEEAKEIADKIIDKLQSFSK